MWRRSASIVARACQQSAHESKVDARAEDTGIRRREKAERLRQGRILRLTEEALEQGGLLNIAELNVILNKSYEVTRQYIRQWEEEMGELLPMKGYRMDQGSRPTHKKEIVRLYGQGLEPPDVARETGHSLRVVERYLKDYERVKLLLKQGMAAEEIGGLIGRGKRVVIEYVEVARQYHPGLFAGAD